MTQMLLRPNPLTDCSSVLLILPPENIRKPKDFAMFTGGTDKQQRAIMSTCIISQNGQTHF